MPLLLKFMNLALNRTVVGTCAFGLSIALLAAYAQDATQQETHGIVVGNMDKSVKPGDNFYEYANGDWIKRTELPPDRSRIGVFSTLADQSDKRTAALIEESAKGGGQPGSGPRKIGDLYNSYMDEAGIEAKGLAPVQPHLKEIAAISNKQQLAAALGESLRADVDALNNTNFHTSHLF
jgi:putative endopeptidase